MKRYLYIVVLLNLIVHTSLYAQTLEEARELYKVGEFRRALPVFEKEHAEKPTNPSLNQWYGVCMLETGGDMTKAEEYIAFASQKGIQDAPLYLGRIYTKTYRFAEAAKEYEKYAKLKRKDKVALEALEKDKNYLAQLTKVASHPEDIQIIDSIVVSKNDFLSAYKLSLSSGSIENYASVFGIDKKIESTIYLNEKKDKIYYAKPTGEKSAYSLFSMEKLLDKFENKKQLSTDNFGLSRSLNYPFVMSDGVTTYFSAQDEVGFGGYDIYVTRYNLNNDTYLSPERLSMPVNSSFNDYLYVIDEEKGVGWFASDRFQPEGKVCIYTFIPNSKVENIESEDNNYLTRRARIASIKETWKTDANYTSLIAQSRKTVVVEKEIKKDFEFVINDKHTYYLFSDFKDLTAKSIYGEFVSKSKELQNIDMQLDNLRDSYRSSASNTKAQEILGLEGQKVLLMNQTKDLEVKARNQEIKSLNR